MSSVARVIVVEDNGIIRLGIKALFSTLPDYRLTATFTSVMPLYKHLDEHGTDILILDDSMPSLDTASVLRYLRFNYGGLKVIVYGSDLYAPLIREYLDEGALAFIYKEEQSHYSLADGLNTVRQGKPYLSHQASMLLLSPAGNVRPLAKRAYQVLKAMAEGLTVKEIARKLDISKKAVYSAQDRLREQFNVKRNEAVVAEAIAQGILKNRDLDGPNRPTK